MADAVISHLVERVLTFIEDKIGYEVNLVKNVKDDFLNLSKKLEKIREVLEDAEKRAVKEQRVKSWMKELEATAYEMEDILDEWNYDLIEHENEASVKPEQKIGYPFIPSIGSIFDKLVFRRNTDKKIENVEAKLAQILKERDDFKFEPNSQPTTDPVREQSTSSIDLKKVHGLDIERKKNDIVSKLMLDADSTQILSIVGKGGLGKTTLAQLIFHDSRFDKDWLKIWVCVSDPFDVAVVAKDIVQSVVGKETIPPNAKLELILQKLKASISGKKFLLILDDVWTEDKDKWEPLEINLNLGAPGSKILVTTRNERVARMMGTLDDHIYQPKELSPEDCWSLLRYTSLAGKNEEECGKFENVGMKIASKCKGLPLAAVVLGRLLRFKDLEGWKHVERSEIWELDNEEVKLFPHLVLSYNELSPALKRCFSYCAAYSKDHRIHAKTLIEQWMAQGYLGSISGNCEVELKGREYLENLAMRSLFQDIEKSESGEEIEWCKMHDIIHDFALFLRKNDDKERSCQDCDSSLASHVQEYRSLSWYTEESCHVCDCLKSVRVLRFKGKAPPLRMETLIHLRWVDLSWTELSKDDLEIICRLYFLQSLVLSGCHLTEIPREIGNLVQLRQLDLICNRGLKELPESMCRLVELRTLSLEDCSLEEIPQEIGNLVRLRRLDLSRNTKLKELPESMYNLVELRSLSLNCCSLKEIQKEIGNLVQLRRLDLSDNVELKELPESMYSLVELRSLYLKGCSLKEIQKEIGNLVQLRHLDLSENEELKELPESICSLAELQILEIDGTDIKCLPEALGDLSILRTMDLQEYKVGSEYNKLGFLKKLYRHFNEYLSLEIYCSSMSEMVELVEDARQAQLKTHLQKLEKLEICFECGMDEMEQSSLSSSSSSMWMELLEALEPNHMLTHLTVQGYNGSRLPHWMSSPLNFIKEIDLIKLSEVSSLPAMGKLPFLEMLCISEGKQLKLVGREFLGIESSSDDDVVVAFPKLIQLYIAGCSKWEEWEDITEEEEESAAISIMPCLTELFIICSESLKKLPHRLLRKVSSSLQVLYISGSSELVKTYGEKEGSAWRSISQHNPQLQLQQWF